MGKLLDYVRSSTEIGDLPTLAFRSGVDYQLLALLDEGSVTLSSHHVEALSSILGPEAVSILSASAAIDKLDSVVSRRGATPPGYKLEVVEAGSIIPGDMVSYLPPSSAVGSHWVSITRTETHKSRAQFFIDLFAGDDKLISITKNQIIRIARRAAS